MLDLQTLPQSSSTYILSMKTHSTGMKQFYLDAKTCKLEWNENVNVAIDIEI